MTEQETETSGEPRVRWRTRAVALAVDLLPGLILIAASVVASLGFPLGGRWWWGCVLLGAVAAAATAANRLLLPVLTGWSLGRAFTGSVADAGGKRRPPRTIRPLVGAVFLGAAAVCAAVALAGYLVVYQRDHRADLARAELARQGPKIVADMLSYEPDSLPDDFARAQQLATPRYREQLAPQQEAIRAAQPVPNLYRVTDAAVLSATADRATMLLFLQGQRGSAGRERLITATVRVVFAKSAGDWRVDDLAVVGAPLTAEEEK